MPLRVTRAKRVKVETGETAIAPRVDDPRGFGIENHSGQELTVSFRYDERTHVQIVVVERERPARQAPGEAEQPGSLPV
jgi:hypothetical protein